MKFQKKITLEKKTKFCFIFSFQKSPKKNLPTQHFFPTFERVAAAWWRNDAPTKSCHYLPLPTQRAVRVCICAFLVRTKKNDGRRCSPKWKQSHPLPVLLLLTLRVENHGLLLFANGTLLRSFWWRGLLCFCAVGGVRVRNAYTCFMKENAPLERTIIGSWKAIFGEEISGALDFMMEFEIGWWGWMEKCEEKRPQLEIIKTQLPKTRGK